MNDVLKAIANRRSIRQFGPGQIGDAELAAILGAALQAPSGHNDQSCYFAVVQDPELIKELSDGSKIEMQKVPVEWISNLGKNEKFDIYYNAPTIVIAAARKDAVSPAADVCAAIQNILIAAESLQIGSCWIGFAEFYFNGPDRYGRVGIPEGYEVHYGVALGPKPAGPGPKVPARKYERYYHVMK